ncbi:phosphate ABC transporter permease PstA [Photobacterium sp. BZF1]|uniref:phosphate ABC transporter permease PstA n=1 Tax=Photobacterium sp. BZF1 TaxID=1904457 RepID=UPI0016535FD8|nr:phosphate ABC transporter permease PstA [Photobacterium sp. BZF1]MBC7001738.1 phosphate ABC transporter permease PstA [Photobacterium sp. BZF1]
MSDPLLRLSERKVALVRESLSKRHRIERRFQFYGVASILSALAFLIFLLTSIIFTGVGAFTTTQIEMRFYVAQLGELPSARSLIRSELQETFEQVTTRAERRALYGFVSPESEFMIQRQLDDGRNRGKQISIWVPAGDRVNQFRKGKLMVDDQTGFSSKEYAWYRQLEKQNKIRSAFNWHFFTAGDSRNPEAAGIAGAFMGSMFTLLTALVLSFPIGVGAAIYLEEFAPKNRITDIIEININNLAAVPSIVFGLLGLAIFLNVLGLPRSTPVVGGLVLTLMTLPTIIISSRASLKSVPPSIRDGALAMGASKTQVVFHHVLPLALPGMFTGSIIGMAQALGETAPLLMIGMVAFIVDVPTSFVDAATALPVQIFLWSENPERGFVELTSAAIIVLLFFLFLMNGIALYLRKKLERRW